MKKMIYIAGKWKDRETIKQMAKELEERGHDIVCKWYNDEQLPYNKFYTSPEVKRRFIRDFQACDDCHVFILYMGNGENVVGAYVELGITYCLDYQYRRKRILAIGKQKYSVPLYAIEKWYDNLEELIKWENL